MDHKPKEPYLYTITEITHKIKVLIEGSFDDVWVLGEVSNLRIPQSGHLYFTLKDENSSLRAVLFKGNLSNIEFSPEDGMMVRAHGYLSVYEPRGEYQLVVDQIEPAGLGSLYIAFEKLKERLKREGLFDPSHKRPIPFLPDTIGVITSPTGAAIRDILNVIRRRFFNVRILICPVRVQGPGAALEIDEAIRMMNTYDPRPDVLLLGRGGGSIEDLWAFNEEVVARSIYDSKIPIISCVGHETDFTIADFVADLRAPTPSAAAELVVQNREELISKLRLFRTRFNNRMKSILSTLTIRLEHCINSPVFTRPYTRINELSQRIDDLSSRIETLFFRHLERKRASLELLGHRLEALNPVVLLSKGYSITFRYPGGEVVRDVAQLVEDESIRIRVYRGEVISRVMELREGERVGEV
jgi:exodeoxyribonuclease VII large subunit